METYKIVWIYDLIMLVYLFIFYMESRKLSINQNNQNKDSYDGEWLSINKPAYNYGFDKIGLMSCKDFLNEQRKKKGN